MILRITCQYLTSCSDRRDCWSQCSDAAEGLVCVGNRSDVVVSAVLDSGGLSNSTGEECVCTYIANHGQVYMWEKVLSHVTVYTC